MTTPQMPEAPLEALSKAPTEVFGYVTALAGYARKGWERVAQLEEAIRTLDATDTAYRHAGLGDPDKAYSDLISLVQ